MAVVIVIFKAKSPVSDVIDNEKQQQRRRKASPKGSNYCRLAKLVWSWCLPKGENGKSSFFIFFIFFLTFPDISDIFGKVIIANW